MPRLISLLLLAFPLVLAGCPPTGDDDDSAAEPGSDFEGDETGECSDEADNDQDGLFDCDDPDCAGAPPCQADDDDATADDDDATADDDDATADDDDATADDDDDDATADDDDDDSVANGAPSITSAEISPANGDETTTFTCTGLGWNDPDGDPEDYVIQWFVNAVPTSLAPTITGALFDRDDLLTCTAQPFDGQLYGAPLWSNPVQVGNAAPSLAAASLALDAVAGVFVATASGWSDPDNDAEGYTYAWTLDGVPTAGSEATLPMAGVLSGTTVGVAITPDDGLDAGSPALATLDFDGGVSLSPATLDFGELEAGCSVTEDITITNTGSASVNLTDVWFEDLDGTGALDVSFGPALPFALGGGDSITATVQFDPADLPPSGGLVHVENDGPTPDATSVVAGSAHFGAPAWDSTVLGSSVDILFVVDNSCSMAEEQGQLGTWAANLFDTLDADGLDYHVGVVTTDNGALQGVDPFIDVFTPDADLVFAANVDLGTTGSGTEQPFLFAHNALNDPALDATNAGFLRPGSDLFVVVVSDEEEQSSGFWPNSADWIADMALEVGSEEQIHVSAISGGQVGCTGPGGSANSAMRLIHAINQTSGLDLPICDDPWDQHLTDLGLWIGDIGGALNRVRLSETPSVASITVTQNSSSLLSGWEFEEASNSILLDPPGLEGDLVDVRYNVFGGMCTPNLAPTAGLVAPPTTSTCEPMSLYDTGSSDPDGSLAAWYWTIESLPATSAFRDEWLDGSVDGELSFTPDSDGTWEFGLVVLDDGGAGSPLETVSVSVLPSGNPSNTAPVVDLDPSLVISETGTCSYDAYNVLQFCPPCFVEGTELDASGSFDPDGGWLLYSWTLLGNPPAEIGLSGADESVATLGWAGGLGMLAPGTATETIEVELTATDCNGASVTTTSTITLECTAI